MYLTLLGYSSSKSVSVCLPFPTSKMATMAFALLIFFLDWSVMGFIIIIIKSPKQQSLGDLLFLLRFLLLFSFSFLSADHELVHGRSQELLDRIS